MEVNFQINIFQATPHTLLTERLQRNVRCIPDLTNATKFRRYLIRKTSANESTEWTVCGKCLVLNKNEPGVIQSAPTATVKRMPDGGGLISAQRNGQLHHPQCQSYPEINLVCQEYDRQGRIAVKTGESKGYRAWKQVTI